MPLTGMDGNEIARLEQHFLDEVPVDGSSIGNRRLRVERLNWDNDLYLAVRKRLVDSGMLVIGRGRGGSLRRTLNDEGPVHEEVARGEAEFPEAPVPFPDEASLYDSMLRVIRDRWIMEQPFDQYLVERTDRGGRRPDGVWTRPDITVAAMTSYTFVPGRHFDIVTFEVKHHSGLNVTAVYEALAHRRSASRAYVLVYIPDELLDTFESPMLTEITDEAARHGIGLIVAGDPADFDTWDVREEPTRIAPDPARMNTFIRNQLSEGSRDQIVRWFR